MLYISRGSEKDEISNIELKQEIWKALSVLGKKKKVLVIPPDFTRIHSRAGLITQIIYIYYKNKLVDILPALGTHKKMSDKELFNMFGDIPKELFRVHNWTRNVDTLGSVKSDYIEEKTGKQLCFSWPVQVNKLISKGGHDLIISIGQVVPHEVTGMSSFNKNIFIGTGGKESIDKSHYISAVYGIERIMGRAQNPVRDILNYASTSIANNLPIIYILTVIGNGKNGNLVIKGLFIGDDEECYKKASELSAKINIIPVERPLSDVVVYLDPIIYKSIWLGNKSIYRIRMAIRDSGRLTVIAPGIKAFSENTQIDRVIRKYGYTGKEKILHEIEKNDELKENLCAASHLIHGSTEGRFSIMYCPGFLSKREIESVGYEHGNLKEINDRYKPGKLKMGSNILAGGKEIYFISNPGLGLWVSPFYQI